MGLSGCRRVSLHGRARSSVARSVRGRTLARQVFTWLATCASRIASLCHYGSSNCARCQLERLLLALPSMSNFLAVHPAKHRYTPLACILLVLHKCVSVGECAVCGKPSPLWTERVHPAAAIRPPLCPARQHICIGASPTLLLPRMQMFALEASCSVGARRLTPSRDRVIHGRPKRAEARRYGRVNANVDNKRMTGQADKCGRTRQGAIGFPDGRHATPRPFCIYSVLSYASRAFSGPFVRGKIFC